MTSGGDTPAAARAGPPRRVARIAWLAGLVVVAVAILLPASLLGELRAEYPWLSRALSRLDRAWPGVDMTHAVLFAAIGTLTGLAFARRRFLGLAAALALLAAASELAQFAVPGRTPSWREVGIDIAAGWLALGIVRAGSAAVRGWRARRRD